MTCYQPGRSQTLSERGCIGFTFSPSNCFYKGASSPPDPVPGGLQPPVPPCIPRGSASRALCRSWYQDLGTKILVPRSWYQDLVPGSWYQDLGTKILVPRSWYQDVGIKILVPRFTMGSQVHGGVWEEVKAARSAALNFWF